MDVFRDHHSDGVGEKLAEMEDIHSSQGKTIKTVG